MESISHYYKSMEETQTFYVTISEGMSSWIRERFHVVLHAIKKQLITFMC